MLEINRILCPVDLSDVSRHAIDYAVLLARWYKAEIAALHVCNPIVIPSTDLTLAGIGPPPVLVEEDIREVREQVLARFDSARPLAVDVLVDSGPPARQILERARSLPADLIVIGTHGAGGFQHLVLGSITEKVLRQAACDVPCSHSTAVTERRCPARRVRPRRRS